MNKIKGWNVIFPEQMSSKTKNNNILKVCTMQMNVVIDIDSFKIYKWHVILNMKMTKGMSSLFK